MATGQVSRVVEQLRRAVLQDGGELSDGGLLDRFLAQRDEAAFASLVRRHGPMVLGVCRRILGNVHDAEDAFQATFLVVVRKASTLVSRDNIGNWLYGVACNSALKARTLACKRRDKERQVRQVSQPDEAWPELLTLLDQELSRLPDRYREPVVLCDLEGKTRKEAARSLGVPEGTLSTWLSRARAKLASRLSRRGVTLSAGALATVLSQNVAAASVPPTLAASTVKAAVGLAAGQALAGGLISANVVTLMEGVLKAMLLAKFKIAAVVLVSVAVVATGIGLVAHQALAQKAAKPAAKDNIKGGSKEDAADRAEISGVVKSVDVAQSTVTLQEGKKGGAQITLQVTRDAKVLLDDGTGDKTGLNEGKLSDLTEGVLATLRLTPDRKSVTRILAEGPSVQGVVKSVNAGAGTITMSAPPKVKGEPAADKTFQITKEARIVVDDGSGDKKTVKSGTSTLADVPVGAQVSLKLSGDQKTVGSLSAHGQSINGTIKAVDPAKNTITLGGKDNDQTYQLAGNARIVIADGGKGDKGDKKEPMQVKLADLAIGSNVALRLSLDGKTVTGVQALGSKIGGVLKSVDAGKSTITVSVSVNKSEQPVDQTIEVARDARISIDEHQDKKLTDLPIESHVAVTIAANHKGAVAVHIEGPSVSGILRGNAAGGTLTISVGKKGGNDDLTVPVAKDAKVLIDDRKEGTAADLIDGSIVHLKVSADKKEIVGAIRAEGPSYQGVIKSVDASSITLNIGGKKGGGEDKTFALTKDTVIVTAINGVALKATDLKVDKDVQLRLALDQKAATRIVVMGE